MTLDSKRKEFGRVRRKLAMFDAALAHSGPSGDPFAAAVRTTRMPVVVTNPRLVDNPVVFANNAFCHLTGYSREEILGRNCRILQGPETDLEAVAKLRQAVLKQMPLDIELKNYSKNGEQFWNRLHMVPLHDDTGALTYFFASQLDVTVDRERLIVLERQNQALLAEVTARQTAEICNTEKSRFLATASHDLRQPLQSLLLMQDALAAMVHGQQAEKLVGRLGQMLESMSSMLNSLLDLDQIEAGVVRTDLITVPVGDILNRIVDGFAFDAKAKGLVLKIVPCGFCVRSDPRLLEQILRNLVANAVKYTNTGTVLVGCRRRGSILSLEVWDTGIGIPPLAVAEIFQEYHQVNNARHQSSRGSGLGLAIAYRLGALLNHAITVRSDLGRGSMFAIELPIAGRVVVSAIHTARGLIEDGVARTDRQDSTILLIEEDQAICGNLQALIGGKGYVVVRAHNDLEAIDMIENGNIKPDLIVTDSHLRSDRNGLTFVADLRKRLAYDVPVITLAGDVSAETLFGMELHDSLKLTRPVKLRELVRTVQKALSMSHSISVPGPQVHIREKAMLSGCLVFVVDDNENIGEDIRALIEAAGGLVEVYGTSEAFMSAYRPSPKACLVVDAILPGMNGIGLLRQLRHGGDTLPAILITGNSDVAMAVDALKAGASDFIEKPFSALDLLASIQNTIASSRDSDLLAAWRDRASTHLTGLTVRQHQVMVKVLAGHPSKNIATDLGISQRTVENHRASIMRKTGAKSLPALARLALAADWDGADGPVVVPTLV